MHVNVFLQQFYILSYIDTEDVFISLQIDKFIHIFIYNYYMQTLYVFENIRVGNDNLYTYI